MSGFTAFACPTTTEPPTPPVTPSANVEKLAYTGGTIPAWVVVVGLGFILVGLVAAIWAAVTLTVRRRSTPAE